MQGGQEYRWRLFERVFDHRALDNFEGQRLFDDRFRDFQPVLPPGE